MQRQGIILYNPILSALHFIQHSHFTNTRPCNFLSSTLTNMAETFVSVLAEKVLGKLGSSAYEEVCLAWGFKNDIQKLTDTLTTIKVVLLDAEERQLQNPKLRVWLQKLKEVCYDTEDVLDEIEYEALHKKVVNRRSITRKVRHFFSSSNPLAFRFAMGHKIKEIRERLAVIAADKDSFNLTEKIDNKRVTSDERETYSFVLASDVIGRDEDKEKIVNLLMHPNDGANISVIPIVGLGGLGKTTVAKMVYNDERVDESFALKMWVCVSNEFSIKKLMVDIIESATSQNHSTMKIEQLQRIFRDTLRSKKYLLVMDDVWNEDSKLWMELRNLLPGGINGSKIIVTTRSYQVASIMGTVPAYNLGILSLEQCLSVFVKCAFREGTEEQHPNLLKIGKEIVKKCGGIPLAAKTLGSLLCSSTDEQDWKKVRDDEIWKLEQRENDVLHALRLSYDHLPSYLKQCFAYCSVFPKDYPFNNFQIVGFWMAHGLLNSLEEDQVLENIGNRYLKELISRSFFQDVDQEKYYSIYTFKMHDLMHDLASSLMKNECLIVKSGSQICPKTVRHLAFDNIDRPKIDCPSFLSTLGHLRTILFTHIGIGPSQSFLKSFMSNSFFLRVLYLSHSNIEAVPKEIVNLKHLKYLDLGYNKIKILPNSICKLYNLQTLFLKECEELEDLPRDMRYLISLRVLNFTVIKTSLLKNKIGCLNSLQELGICNCPKLEYLFEDIVCLKSLRRLGIQNCPCLISLPHGIKYLSSLENLLLINCERLDLNLSMGSELAENNCQDFSSTRPHLQLLVVRGLPQLVELPQWFLQFSADSLQKLYIEECSNFKALPHSMQNLQSLQYLDIWGCPNLSSLPEDTHRLTTLREIRIRRCPTLSKRCEREKGEDWPKIADIRWIKSSKA